MKIKLKKKIINLGKKKKIVIPKRNKKRGVYA